MRTSYNWTYRSPNFDERALPISLIVLHYTGMDSGRAAIERLCDPLAKVSAHYVVEENGDIYALVDEERRAWHAGVSRWHGLTDINSASVGIEIVNGGHDFGLPEFPAVQIKSVIALCRDIQSRRAIGPLGVVGHSDIAPGRKSDPGPKFPWEDLAKSGIGVWPSAPSGAPNSDFGGDSRGDHRVLFAARDRERGIALAQRALAGFGYSAEITGVMDAHTVSIIEAFQQRFRPSHVTGEIDVETLSLISALSRF